MSDRLLFAMRWSARQRYVDIARIAIAICMLSPGTSQAVVIAEYDSGAGTPLSPTTQGWVASQVIEAGDPTPPLATVVNTTGDGTLANAGAGATGWIVRDYLDGADDGLDDRPEYNHALDASDFNLMTSNGWTYTATFTMDSVVFNSEMRFLSIDQGGGDGLPYDIKIGATYIGDTQSGNLGLLIQGEQDEVDTGVPAEQLNTVVLAGTAADGSFTISVNGSLLNGGATFNSTPNNGNEVPGDDVLVIGANATGHDGMGIEYDLVRLEAGDDPITMGLSIDRNTGQILLSNDSGVAKTIVGYQIDSPVGSLDPSSWLSIADNYDVSGGGATVDSNDEWIELTDPTSRTDLSEFEPDGDGALVAAGQSIDLGNAWIKNPTEDLVGEVLLADGTIEVLPITFLNGPNNEGFEFGDLDFDGDFDVDDFNNVFVPGFGADTTGLSSAERYQAGDFNNDDVVDEFDFLTYNEAYLSANPGAASLSLAVVPEPGTIAFCSLAGLMFSGFSKRRWKAPKGIAALILLAFLASGVNSAHAAGLIAHWNFDEAGGATTLSDSVGANHSTAIGTAVPGSAGQIGNAWTFDGSSDAITINPGSGNLTGLGEDYSFTGWVNSTDNFGVIFSISDNTEGSEELALRVSDNGTDGRLGLLGRPNLSGPGGEALSTSFINNGAWRHVAFTSSASGWNVYVDGVLETSGTPSTSPTSIGANAIHFGTNEDSSGQQWGLSGQIDDFSVWNGPLQASEIEDLYLKGQFGVSALDPFNTVLSLDVNTVTGNVTMKNDAGLPFDIDAYRIVSVGDSLNAAGWDSLDDQGFDSAAWTELGNGDGKVSEGAFGGSSVLSDAFSMSLGNLYDTGDDLQDLVFEYHVAGLSANLLVEGTVNYVTGPDPGDFDSDGDVDGADFLAWQRGNSPNPLSASDLAEWESNYGAGAGPLSASTSVPEPSTGLMLLLCLATVGMFFCDRRDTGRQKATVGAPSTAMWGSWWRCVVAVVACLGIAGSTVAATNDRDYTLGDDPDEASAANATLTGPTFDSAGSSGAGDFQDLLVDGAPVYRNVDGATGRPGADAGDLGVEFDGASDRLRSRISMNAPTQMWDNTTFFPGPPSGVIFPHNYEGIFTHGIQLWAKPNVNASRQDLVMDTTQHGIFITADNTWGLQYANVGHDSGVTVASSLDANGWVHVMQASAGGDGRLFVNGVAVAVRGTFYGSSFDDLSIGSNVPGDGNFYSGVLDDVRLFLWGDNSDQLGQDGVVGGVNDTNGLNADGQDYGGFDLGGNNDWIVQELARLATAAGVAAIPDGDVNFDGVVSGDGSGPASTDDVTAFVEGWNSVRLVDGALVGDWVSRQRGDFDFDGVVDLDDAFVLRSGLLTSGLGTLDFSLLTGAVIPEPSTSILAFLGMLGLLSRFNRSDA